MAGRNSPSTRIPAKSAPIRNSLDGHARFRLLAPAENILLPLLDIRRRLTSAAPLPHLVESLMLFDDGRRELLIVRLNKLSPYFL